MVDRRIAGIAALDQPLRRDLYRLLSHAGRWMGRDEAAKELNISRSVAAFHLDKMVESGILETHFARVSGRSGPGAGRPSKLYSPTESEVSASVPDRRYDLAGSLLAAAVTESASSGSPVEECLRSVAYAAGSETAVHDTNGDMSAGESSQSERLMNLLSNQGYEPQVVSGASAVGNGDDESGGSDDSGACDEIALANCPFHRLAEDHRELVCGMNFDYLSGVLDGLGAPDTMAARLQPEPGYCCVRIGTAKDGSRAATEEAQRE